MTVVGGIGLAVAILVGIILIYLVTIVFLPGLSVPKQPIPNRNRDRGERKPSPEYREDVEFAVDGIKIRAWLYLPKNVSGAVPCVVMNHGFGGTKDALLERYAERFVAAGLATLTYDYRHFGESEGEPRQLFATTYQLDDLRSAIAFVRSRDEIDADRIVLWGTSAGGGYGVTIAAEDHKIAAVIAQCAGIDHKADSDMFMKREGIGYMLRLIPHAQRDKGRSRFGLSPHRFPMVGRPGTVAMLAAPGTLEGYARLMQDSDTFKNEVCARLLFMAHGPDPLEASKQVRCPVLFLVCENDNLASPDSHKRATEFLGDKAEVRGYPIGHFDIYEGEWFEKAVGEKIAFLERHLGAGGIAADK